MKLSLYTAALVVSSATAFAPSAFTASRTSLTQANLFGDAEKGEGGDKKPGMFDQLAMLKKAQELASKKKEIEKDLQAMEFQGSAADGKVTATMKYVASSNAMDPTPDYSVEGFDFDDEWFEAASAEDLSTAVLEAYQNGLVETKKATEEKFAALADDLKDMMGAVTAPAPAS